MSIKGQRSHHLNLSARFRAGGCRVQLLVFSQGLTSKRLKSPPISGQNNTITQSLQPNLGLHPLLRFTVCPRVTTVQARERKTRTNGTAVTLTRQVPKCLGTGSRTSGRCQQSLRGVRSGAGKPATSTIYQSSLQLGKCPVPLQQSPALVRREPK